MNTILFALWFFAPAGLANSAPIFSMKIPYLKNFNAPLDFGKSFKGNRIFGANKRWRGLIIGMAVSTLALAIQQYLFENTGWAQTISGDLNYSKFNVFILGPLFGFGALAGDAVESFFKRQMKIGAGESWFPFDQIDYIIGGLLAVAPIVMLGIWEYVMIFLVWFMMHLGFSYLGYLTHFKDKPI